MELCASAFMLHLRPAVAYCDSSAPMCTASGLKELSIQALNKSACNVRLAGWTRMHVCKMRT